MGRPLLSDSYLHGQHWPDLALKGIGVDPRQRNRKAAKMRG